MAYLPRFAHSGVTWMRRTLWVSLWTESILLVAVKQMKFSSTIRSVNLLQSLESPNQLQYYAYPKLTTSFPSPLLNWPTFQCPKSLNLAFQSYDFFIAFKTAACWPLLYFLPSVFCWSQPSLQRGCSLLPYPSMVEHINFFNHCSLTLPWIYLWLILLLTTQ